MADDVGAVLARVRRLAPICELVNEKRRQRGALPKVACTLKFAKDKVLMDRAPLDDHHGRREG